MGLTTWLLSTDLGREQLALLAFCMLAAYVVAANLVWRMVRARPSPASGRSSRWRWIGAWIAQGVRSLYYVGVPVAVIGRGA